MRYLLFILLLYLSLPALANGGVTYLEKVGNGGTRAFAVSLPVQGRKGEALKDAAKHMVINAILFEGVDYYNGGRPLVGNPENVYAKEIVDTKKGQYRIYCKEIYLENPDSKTSAYFIVLVNHFNLLRVLNMRKVIDNPFEE